MKGLISPAFFWRRTGIEDAREAERNVAKSAERRTVPALSALRGIAKRLSTLGEELSLGSRFYSAKLMHSRRTPVEHTFSYSVLAAGIFLDELELLDRQLCLFSYNRFNVFSFYDSDYLRDKSGPLTERLRSYLRDYGFTKDFKRVHLTTVPRYFGYVFNPVSFYRCYSSSGELIYFVAEVNNTFGESHLYIHQASDATGHSEFVNFQGRKEFHVSPFYDVAGQYDFRVASDPAALDFHVDLSKDGEKVFYSRLSGRAFLPHSLATLAAALRFPLSAALTTPRIMWHAFVMRFRKGLSVYSRPIADSRFTIRKVGPGLIQQTAFKILWNFLAPAQKGLLTFRFPDREPMSIGGIDSGPEATIHVRNYDLFTKTLFSGDVGFGEAYTAGYWDSDNPTAVVRFFIENLDTLDDRNIAWASFGRLQSRLFHLGRDNRRSQARRNIESHYDLGNEFYQLFLDESLTYSAGYFERESDSLFVAQQQKIDRILDKAKLETRHHLLEIGSGWGALAIRAAKRFSCRVTTVTLSKNQLHTVRERVKSAGVDHLVEVELVDYRDIQGHFDRIVSVEMLEAVGSRHYSAFFRRCDELLRKDGIAVLQVITIPDQRYQAYRKGCDWIQKYIFPGGETPSLAVLQENITKHSRFVVADIENIGIHYARTLREWRERFTAQRGAARALGLSEEFLRTWTYYLCYCEAAFASRYLGTLQMVLSRPGNAELHSCPGYET